MAPSKYFDSSKGSGSKGNAIDLSDSEDEQPKNTSKRGNGSASASKSAPTTKSPARSKRKSYLDDDDDDFDFVEKEDVKAVKKSKGSSSKATPTKNARTSPHKSKVAKEEYADEEDDDDFYEDEKPTKGKSNVKAAKSAAASTSSKAASKKEEDTDMGFEEEAKKKKEPPAWIMAQKRKADGPAMPGSKEIPVGKPNCLAGMTLVFTGELSSISRDEATDLAKRYGAKVTGAPSSKTTYVIVGENAGPSKLKKIEAQKLQTLDEDGFLDLIRQKSAGDIKVDEATKKKLVEEQKKIEKAAKEMQPAKGAVVYDNPLWTVKYAPQTLKDLAGNGGIVTKLQTWLHDWQNSLKANFKKPGKEGMNVCRAVLLSGPPGIGKTSAAHIVAKLEGYTPIELNASDVRSKKLIEASLKDTISNSSLDAWQKGGKIDRKMTVDGLNITDRTVLIMDEVDGMSGGDRGGVGAINALIKKTKVPIICICNDQKNQKMRPFDKTAFHLKFIKPDVRQVKQRIMTIAFREKLKIPAEVIEQLVQSAQSDIRLIINMLSTWSLNKKTMDFDEGKEFGAANAKPGLHTPFTLYGALSSAGMWAPTNKKTLNDKADYYFQDHSIMPLMVQQNYIHHIPVEVTRLNGKERDVRLLQSITKAANSISDGDIVDSMIHSSEQHWSLMPLHGIISTVKPMSFANGNSGNFPSFPTWLGSNSKQQRLMRAAIELQARLRLVTTASRFEVREQYLPYFFPRLVRPMLDGQASDKAAVEIMDFMDEYYLTPEDREIILELGMGENDWESLSKKIPSATKSAFTRKYNSTSHPIAFYKSAEATKKAKKLVGEPAPDVEEAYEAQEEPGDEESDNEGGKKGGQSDDEVDISKDKFFKQKTSKGKGKASKK
ncbi:hypothetical protein L7F22_039101 [Adiantum nelumboides]|nr:hypothetical protein [Adiantum nelumboides]